MNIFHNRPLALISFVAIFSSLCAHKIPTQLKIAVIIIALAVFIFAIIVSAINLFIGAIYGAIEGYYATAALSGMAMDPETYMEKIRCVTAEDVVAAANTVKLHTQYVLKGG